MESGEYMINYKERIKILVAVTDYPNINTSGGGALEFVHTRNKYYLKHNFDVTVLNFSCNEGYCLDGIKVISLSEYYLDNQSYDKLVFHAPNIRNHYRFLKHNVDNFSTIVIFFHGHEILYVNQIYPKLYKYMPLKDKFMRICHSFYDPFKLFIWRRYLPKIATKTTLVFVSEYLHMLYTQFVGASGYKLGNNMYVINNAIGELFEKTKYNVYTEKKEYDFITIRSRLDASECCIDLVSILAVANPQFKFLVIGKGQYFSRNNMPDNLTYIPNNLSHIELKPYIDKSSCALMPTKHDSQGVMSCELASYGIPLITSDIPVCREIFADFKNVFFIENSVIDLTAIYKDAIKTAGQYSDKYYYNNTIFKEEELLR